MKRTSFPRVLWEYGKQRRGIALLLLLFTGLFAVSFYLYGLPGEPIEYGVTLCLFAGAVILAVDFSLYLRRHRKMEALRAEITLSIEALPPPRNLAERDYTELIVALHDERVRTVSQYDNLHSDMVDYYCLWAHQIKTPIAAMHLLLDGRGDEPAPSSNPSCLKLSNMWKWCCPTCAWTRAQATYYLKLYQLDNIVRQAVRKYAAQFVRKKIRLEYHEMDCFVLTDEKWLMFAIEQVLSNALKYTPSGGRVTISLDAPTKTLLIADSGIGIAPEDLPRVCEKGFTGYNGRTDKKSTGIGLYLCKRILTMLSHTIAIESQVGEGTLVRIGLETLDLSAE